MQRLQQELSQIVDGQIREFTEHCLKQAPDYFWSVPSSSSGKYHPEQSNGEGGLVRHTKAVVYFAVKLCDVYSVIGVEKDCIISACILHDIVKYGEVKQSHTTKNHDYEGAMFVKKQGDAFGLDQNHITAISGSVAWHMGKWTDMTGRKKAQAFPDDYTKPPYRSYEYGRRPVPAEVLTKAEAALQADRKWLSDFKRSLDKELSIKYPMGIDSQ